MVLNNKPMGNKLMIALRFGERQRFRTWNNRLTCAIPLTSKEIDCLASSILWQSTGNIFE
jgi:hypothetical protein